MAKEQQDKNSGRKNSQIFIMICAVLIIVLLAIVIVLLVNRGGTDVEEESRRNVVVNPSNAESIVEQMEEDAREFVEPGYFTVNMNTEWHFADGGSVSSNARVDNLAENTNDIYFDVYLAEDESETIYESPIIPLGGYLEDIALDKPLEKGTYDCVMVYHLVDGEQNTISTLRIAFQIVVES